MELQASHARRAMPVGRPAVDVVIPFVGSASALRELIGRLERLELRTGDTVVVVDNRSPRAAPLTCSSDAVRLVSAPDIRSSYYARNRGAESGRAPWLLFIDADVEWSAEVIDAYFDPPPSARTAVVGGEIEDAPIASGRRPSVAVRYARSKRTMAAAKTLQSGDRPPYAQTANCLIMREAFDAVGGFPDGVRQGGDAEICWRLLAAGWQLETRFDARVVHRNRETLSGLLAQKARHGSGAAWLERRHRGTFPRRRLPGLLVWSARQLAAAARRRSEPAEDRTTTAVDVLAVWAFELGRLLPNRAHRR